MWKRAAVGIKAQDPITCLSKEGAITLELGQILAE